MKHYDASIADYQAALRHDPELASSLYGLGLATQAKGAPGAANDFAAAVKIDPKIAADFGT